MAIQLHPSEVSVLVRDINVYFDHYQQYENYFVSISILGLCGKNPALT